MRIAATLGLALGLGWLACAAPAAAAPDYGKRGAPIDPSVTARLVGRWTNPVDKVIIQIDTVDLQSGAIRGREWPTSGEAKGDEHELTGWVSGAAPRPGFDNVVPVTFSTTLHEYGTLPIWAGFLKDGQIVTLHYLVWPNRTYAWDHISSFSETWSRIP